MKLNKITPNAYVLNSKLTSSINNSPFIHKPSVVHLSIRIYRHYIGSQQGSEEITIFLHCLTFIHGIFWVFRNQIIMKFKYINKIPLIHKTSVVYLSIRIHQHQIDSQKDSGEMTLFLH